MVDVENVHIGDYLIVDNEIREDTKKFVIDCMKECAGMTLEVIEIGDFFYMGEKYIRLKSPYGGNDWGYHPSLLHYASYGNIDASDIDITSFVDDLGI